MTKYRVTLVVTDPATDYNSFQTLDVRNWLDSDGNELSVNYNSIEVTEIFELAPGWYRYEGKLYKLWRHLGMIKGVEVKLPEINDTYGTLSPAIMGAQFTITDHEAWAKAERVDL